MLEGLWRKECLLCFGDHKNNSGNYRTLAIRCNVREGFRAQPCTALNQSKVEPHLWSSEAVWPLSSGLPFLRHRPPHLSNDCCEPSVQAHGLCKAPLKLSAWWQKPLFPKLDPTNIPQSVHFPTCLCFLIYIITWKKCFITCMIIL